MNIQDSYMVFHLPKDPPLEGRREEAESMDVGGWG